MGRSGFVHMQGIQEHASPWPHRSSSAITSAEVTTKPLPEDLLDAFMPDAVMPRLSMAALDHGMYLALRDRRAGLGATLIDGESMAGIEGSQRVIRGEQATAFEPAPDGRPHLIGGGPDGPWQIRRLRFLQNIRLSPGRP